MVMKNGSGVLSRDLLQHESHKAKLVNDFGFCMFLRVQKAKQRCTKKGTQNVPYNVIVLKSLF